MNGEPQAHIDDDALIAFAGGRISSDERTNIEYHLLNCASCAARLDALPFDDPFVRRLQDAGEAIGSADPTMQQQPAAVLSLEAGTKVGKYELIEETGRGGMGVVYRASDPEIDRTVAVKFLNETLTGDDQARERFLREAQAVGRLNHAHVVTIHDFGELDGRRFLVMEWLPNSVGRRIAREGALPWTEAVRTALQACRGLHAAHRAGVVHRDVKPDNLLLTDEDNVKLADFGLAKFHDQTSLTGGRALAGTPHFMSPEQCRGEVLDARCDVYALGATLYTMLTARRPYDDKTGPMQVMYAQCNDPPPDPRAVDPNVPADCSDIVRRAMALAPEDRYADCTAFARDLEALLSPRRTSNATPLVRSRALAVALLAILIGSFAVLIASRFVPNVFHSTNSNGNQKGQHDEQKDALPKLGDDPDRAIAVWALKRGAAVRISYADKDQWSVVAIEKLPKEPFRLIGVHCKSKATLRDEHLPLLLKLSKLFELDLSGSPISNDGLKTVASVKTLRTLDLSKTKITDDGIAHLVGMELNALILVDTPITDECIFHLLRLKRYIRTLNATGTKLTMPGLERLRTSLPKCRVYPKRPK